MSRDEYGHYVNDKGVEIKASTSSSGKTKIDIYDSCPAKNEDHGSIHINFDENTGKGTITDTTSGKTETTDVSCYLTTACMKHYMEEFDDNCYYLDILRWFRDNFVSKEDKKEYYEVAPKVVETIDHRNDANSIYQEIYYKVIQVCVKLIEYGRYDEAYEIYKNNVLDLQNKYVKKLVLN